jgi:hypothetical protein
LEVDVTEVAKMPEPAPPADNMVSMIERVAMNPELPIERLEQMLAMKERMEDRAREDEERHARKAFYAALAQAQADIPVVLKNKNNSHTKSKYADLAAIERDAMPVIRRHGFSVSANSIAGADKGFQRVRFRVAHEAGHVEDVEDDFPLDGAGAQGNSNKTALHAKGSTTTYARRYMVTSFFNIATSDDDGNAGGGSAARITEKQFRELRDLIEQTGSDEGKLCAIYGIEMLQEMPAVNFNAAAQMLRQKAKGGAQ